MIISSTRGGASREGTERVVWEARSTMRFRRDLRMNASPTNDSSHSYAYITGYIYISWRWKMFRSIFWTDGNVSNDYSGWILRIEVNYENGLFSDEIFRFFRVVGFKNFKIDWNEFSECSISFVRWFDRSEFLREIFLRMIQLIIWKLKTQRCLNVDYILLRSLFFSL